MSQGHVRASCPAEWGATHCVQIFFLLGAHKGGKGPSQLSCIPALRIRFWYLQNQSTCAKVALVSLFCCMCPYGISSSSASFLSLYLWLGTSHCWRYGVQGRRIILGCVFPPTRWFRLTCLLIQDSKQQMPATCLLPDWVLGQKENSSTVSLFFPLSVLEFEPWTLIMLGQFSTSLPLSHLPNQAPALELQYPKVHVTMLIWSLVFQNNLSAKRGQ